MTRRTRARPGRVAGCWPEGPLTYVPAGRLDGTPHLMVDGAPRAGTRCTLSHWPGTPTPAALRLALDADVSTAMVLAALARRDVVPAGLQHVTVDHFDQDGAIGVALLCVDGLERHGPLLVEAARVGDFGVVRRRDAALVAFALAALGDAAPHHVGRPRPAAGDPVRAALAVLPDLADDPDAHRHLWHDEAAAFDASAAAFDSGAAQLREVPQLDAAVVTAEPEALPAAAAWRGAPLHPAAVHSRTDRLRVVTAVGPVLEARFRYETWVRLPVRPAQLRVDLSPLAARLSDVDPSGARWVFDGAGAITPALHPVGPRSSGLDPNRFVEQVLEALAAAAAQPPVWDPYR